MAHPGLALLIGQLKKGRRGSPDDEDSDMEDPKSEPKSEHAAMSSFIEAVHGGDEQEASEALKDYLTICFPSLEEPDDGKY